jgi:hypothetical protein
MYVEAFLPGPRKFVELYFTRAEGKKVSCGTSGPVQYGGAFYDLMRVGIDENAFSAMKPIDSYFTRAWEKRVFCRCYFVATFGSSLSRIGKYGLFYAHKRRSP